jgi:uncharacterized protein
MNQTDSQLDRRLSDGPLQPWIRKSCAYYGNCGGGAPANKYCENGSFATAETMFCKYSVKLPLEIVLNDLEAGLGATGGG